MRIWNAFSEMGVNVVDETGGKYHVSGHANRPDLEHVHRLILPDMLIPMHGEHRHLREHARIATEAGIAAAVAPERHDAGPDGRRALRSPNMSRRGGFTWMARRWSARWTGWSATGSGWR